MQAEKRLHLQWREMVWRRRLVRMQMKGRRPGQAWPLGVAARPGSGAGTRTLLLGDAEGRAVTRSLMRAVIGAA
jgi:hypothetical protein